MFQKIVKTTDSANPCTCCQEGGRDLDEIPRVDSFLTRSDRLGAWKARWGINRMNYRVDPGIHALGDPGPDSPILVSANYKMSFDRLRSSLPGRSAWILVLDSKGINVWCAAGKGTFGTEEIVRSVAVASLADLVTHRPLIVPQLGAPGVNAQEVKRRSGFKVKYGPVRAEDLPDFLDAGLEAAPATRLVRFPLRDRMALVPFEIVDSLKHVLVAILVLLVLAGLGEGGYKAGRIVSAGIPFAAIIVGCWLAGTVATPVLLPWLPGRAFSLKGACAGLVFLPLALWISWMQAGQDAGLSILAPWILIVPAATSYLGLKFTGATTFTSLSGVLKEMRVAIPLQVLAIAAGLAVLVIDSVA